MNRIFLLLLLVLIAACASPPAAPRDELVDIGTHSLYIHCRGAGAPVVVIDTGIGEQYQGWESVIASLSRETRVCAYDRAGYGRSEPGPMPRHSRRAADELHLLLENAGERGPYLLLGHSLGGLNMQVFAHRYPQEVSGLVLLDPSPLAWMLGQGFPELRELFDQASLAQREQAEAARAASDADIRQTAGFLDAVASEFETFFGATADEVGGIESFEMPVTVIGAAEPEPAFGDQAQAFRRFWNEENEALASRSGSGRFILAEGSSHQIHLDRPDLVVDAVLEMMP